MKLNHFLSISFGILSLVAVAPATVLTFEKGSALAISALSAADLDTYGDNVTGPGPGSDTFLYGTMYGITPDVVTSFGATNSFVDTWGSGFGNLQNVVWGNGTNSGQNNVTLTLTATGENVVNLHEFSLAQWSSGNLIADVAVVVDGITVLSESRAIPNGANNSNYRYLFATPYTGSSISITFGNAWWHAIDNVGFSQSAVPEPASMIALGCGALALIRRRRK